MDPVDRKISPPQGTRPKRALPVVDLFTDGSCRGKKTGECGGWAYILRHRSTGIEKVQVGGFIGTTSERIEILAVIHGFIALKRPSHVMVHSDSLNIINGISHFLPEWKRFGWRLTPNPKKQINNADLWQILDGLLAGHEVEVKWIKGHAGHPENERCDQLSSHASLMVSRNGDMSPPPLESASAPTKTEVVPADVDLFTDGACLGNPGPGGWAFILRHRSSGTEKQQSGGLANTTNNRMEMLAVIEGLRALKKSSRVVVHSDSQYVVTGINEWMAIWKRRGWRKKLRSNALVKNADLWQTLDDLIAQNDVTANWVRGHVGHPENERCDVLSVEAAQAITRNPNAPSDVRGVSDNGLFKGP